MRKMSLVLVTAAMFLVANVSANINAEPVNSTKNLSAQIHKMLESNSFNVEEDLTANVQFTINKNGEIVVLSVDTTDDTLDSFVKGRLNYQKVDFANFKEGRTYTVPVRIAV
ncbi:hypothetical protein [Croceitalea rosinachiae]|uniref:Uncharacterized protein n=1 Tax=Croceitalea rosinachiae TaxID=3075596 RepID=A0ABU3ADH8_9FLAO|nr:hypothetical protein [Croceitalea sp. F388]MDT0608247.1 hypothetical protein [Croceitalea sp. F388]